MHLHIELVVMTSMFIKHCNNVVIIFAENMIAIITVGGIAVVLTALFAF